MKYLQLWRLGWAGAIKIIFIYFFEKLLGIRVWKNQKNAIAYFNILVNNNLTHYQDKGFYNIVNSSEFGLLALRYPPSSDSKVFVQVFKDKEYECLTSLILKYIKHERIYMIDGGANIGFTTIFLSQSLRSHKKLVSVLIEPFSENIFIMEQNFCLQHFSDFFIKKAGIYHRVANLELIHDFRDGLEWSIQTVESSHQSDLIGIPILDIMNEHNMPRIDILKLDIEGAEKYLFIDKQHAFAFLQHVSIIAIEIHKEYIEEQKILDCLYESGFTVSKSGELYVGYRDI